MVLTMTLSPFYFETTLIEERWIKACRWASDTTRTRCGLSGWRVLGTEIVAYKWGRGRTRRGCRNGAGTRIGRSVFEGRTRCGVSWLGRTRSGAGLGRCE